MVETWRLEYLSRSTVTAGIQVDEMQSICLELIEFRRSKLWTGNHDIDSAIILLDRIDVGNEDFDRIEQVKEIIRGLVNSK